ncbi:hypothetical protein LIA77_11795 [Sarocladium implicatum]|nr:hypothetical protein LIA77_11795 [Sarocladium implicatum]
MNLTKAMNLLRRGLRSDMDVVHEQIARWKVIKHCRSLVALDHTIGTVSLEERKKLARDAIAAFEAMPGGRLQDPKRRDKERQQIHHRIKLNDRTQADVVDGGNEWVVVRALPPRRLAMQMTESGWSWGCYDMGDSVPPEEWEDVTLTKKLKMLVAAAKRNPHEYTTPRIRLVLPFIGREQSDFAVLFDQYARMDPDVQITIEDRHSPLLNSEPPSDYIQNLMGDPLANLTPTLILDHTVLVDLFSDITHFRLEPKPWQSESTKHSIKEENAHPDGGWMIKWLYPVLAGRRLIVTKATVEHIYELLKTVGTDTERERARLLLPQLSEEEHLGPEEAHRRYAALSHHSTPENLQVPLEVEEKDWLDQVETTKAAQAGQIPEAIAQSDLLSAANEHGISVYNISSVLSGWASRSAIVTSNKEVKGFVRRWVEAVTGTQTPAGGGPNIHTIQVARFMLSSNVSPKGEPPEAKDNCRG